MTLTELPILVGEARAAEILEISVDTLQRLRKRSAISYRKIGSRIRYAVADIADFLESQKVPACPKDAYVKSGGSTSPSVPTARPTTSRGSMNEPAKLAELAAAQAIFAPRR